MEGAVLEERYTQLLRKPCCIEPRNPGGDELLAWAEGGRVPRARGVVARRRLLSEVLLIPVSGGMRIGYRDVFEVDGKPVQERTERLRGLFESSSAESEIELGRIAAESARFNLGPLRRTANLPTMPLLFLTSARRPGLYFSRGGRDERDGHDLVEIDFREDGSPTLVADADGRDMPARGRLWIEPGSGAVREIELRVGERVRRILHVWFRNEPRMSILVPDRMWEWYERIKVPGETWPVDLEALATYTEVRLFTVSTTGETGDPIP